MVMTLRATRSTLRHTALTITECGPLHMMALQPTPPEGDSQGGCVSELPCALCCSQLSLCAVLRLKTQISLHGNPATAEPTMGFFSRWRSKLTLRSIIFCALSLTKVRLFSSSMRLFCTSLMFDNGAWKKRKTNQNHEKMENLSTTNWCMLLL